MLDPIKHPKYFGVYKDNEFSLKWFAAVRYKTLHKQLGIFDSDHLAAKGYDAAVIRLHLEDVLEINFPPQPELSLFKTILYPPLGLGISVSNSAAEIAQGTNIIKFPMINPNLPFIKAISKLIRLFSMKVLGTLVCNQATRIDQGNVKINFQCNLYEDPPYR